MAGRAAEEQATGKDCPGAASGDIAEAFPLYVDAGFADGSGTPSHDGTIEHQNDGSLYTEWLEEARQFMQRPDHWAEVEALKDELLARGQLTGEEACNVIRGVGRGR